ncbi:MAG: glycosyltransferase family 2 protein [Polyangiales bacterium]
MSRKPTLSVIVPALNEEANIADAVREATRALGNRFEDYELLLFDDGSTDRTGAIMDDLAREDPHVRVFHHEKPRNLGGVYKHGIEVARFEYVIMVPGDNENPGSALQAPFDALGRADMVLPYPTNLHARPWVRRIGSVGYTAVVNLLFGGRARYYNGTVIHRLDNLRSITVRTDSFAYQTEILVKLLRRGKTFVEVGIEIEPRGGRRSQALRLKNLVAVFEALGDLWFDVHVRERLARPSRS